MSLFNHQPLNAGVSISPNPANDEVYFDVKFEKSQEVNVLVNDQMGRMIRRLDFDHNQSLRELLTWRTFRLETIFYPSWKEGTLTKKILKQ